jgi:hypothetical protein
MAQPCPQPSPAYVTPQARCRHTALLHCWLGWLAVNEVGPVLLILLPTLHPRFVPGTALRHCSAG